MSRLALPLRTGLALAVVALLLGVSSAPALGCGGCGGDETGYVKGHGKKDSGKEAQPPPKQEQPPPKQEQPGAVTTPAPTTPSPAVTTPSPTVTTPQPVPGAPGGPAAPVTAQGAPSAPGEEQDTERGGGGQEGGGEQGPTVQGEQEAGTEQAPLAPAAERKELADTGLHPGLIALMGVLFLAGGTLLMRRSLAR